MPDVVQRAADLSQAGAKRDTSGLMDAMQFVMMYVLVSMMDQPTSSTDATG